MYIYICTAIRKLFFKGDPFNTCFIHVFHHAFIIRMPNLRSAMLKLVSAKASLSIALKFGVLIVKSMMKKIHSMVKLEFQKIVRRFGDWSVVNSNLRKIATRFSYANRRRISSRAVGDLLYYQINNTTSN